MKLYEITENYNNLLELLDNPEVEPEMLVEALNNVQDEFNDKVENVVKVIKNMEADVKAYKDEEKRLADRRKAAESRIVNLKGYLQSAMDYMDKPKIKGKVFTISVQNNQPAVEIMNENELPKECWKVREEIDKTKIKEMLKNGEQVPGAVLTVSRSVRIR